MRWAAALVALAACDPRAHVGSCADDLDGAWRDGAGRRWAILDHRGSARALELFPMFDDSAAAPGGVTAAPRRIDARPSDGGLAGQVGRRFMLRAAVCEGRAPFQIAACHDDALDVVTSDPAAPTGFAPCAWPRAATVRAERWHRD